MVLQAEMLSGMPVGGSISVNGACLTAVSVEGTRVSVNIVPETLSRTAFSHVSAGDRVNLERPMTPESLFDGHIVQGHIDGVGTVARVEVGDGSARIALEASDDLMRYIVEKGSVTLDGVSLTVATASGSCFEVALIPHTLAITTLGNLEAGDVVNLEVDVLAKYVERLLKQ